MNFDKIDIMAITFFKTLSENACAKVQCVSLNRIGIAATLATSRAGEVAGVPNLNKTDALS